MLEENVGPLIPVQLPVIVNPVAAGRERDTVAFAVLDVLGDPRVTLFGETERIGSTKKWLKSVHAPQLVGVLP